MPVKNPSVRRSVKKPDKGKASKRRGISSSALSPDSLVLSLVPRGTRVSYRKYRVLPNPWPPANIERLLEIAVTVAGLAPVAYKLIALWIEDRKAQKIKIKHGQHELEIQGGVSGRKIELAINKFRKLAKLREDDEVKIVLPRGVDRSVPLEMVREAHQREAKKSGTVKKAAKKR